MRELIVENLQSDERLEALIYSAIYLKVSCRPLFLLIFVNSFFHSLLRYSSCSGLTLGKFLASKTEVIIGQTGMLKFQGLYSANWNEFPAGKMLHLRCLLFSLS